MNNTLIALLAGIVIVVGLIGYTVLGKSAPSVHTDGDGHTTVQHEATEKHSEGDGHTEDEHAGTTGSVPHDDTGTVPHND